MKLFRKLYGYLNALISRGYWYNNVKFRDCSKFWTYNTFNTDVVNLGSSSAVNAFNYDGISLKCANWALNTNPLAGDLAILDNYLSYIKEKDATVIIPLCPFSSLSGSYSISDDRYYTILYPSSIPSYSIRRHTQIKSVLDAPFQSYPLWYLYCDIKSYFGRKNDRVLTEIEMEKDAENWISNWMNEFSVKDFSYPLSLYNQDSINDAANYLNMIIKRCKDHNMRPIVLIPPVYHTLGEKFTPDIREVVIESLINKIEDSNIWFHNYMDDMDFTNERSYFANSFLMNKQGAKLFTKRLLSDIGKL